MQALAGPELLSLWERGASRHALDRSALLAAAARPDWPAAGIADRPLGQVNASLLRLRAATFGPRIDGHADCTQCGQRLAFTLDARVLLPATADEDDAPRTTEAAGLRVRAPSLRDLAGVATEADAERAMRALLARCTLAGDLAQVDDAALATIEDALDALDPQADLVLALQCVACGHAGQAQLDAGALLWDEIDAQARVLLAEVHRLASAYGWSEAQILALSPARRASYLALVEAR
ncbi:hypothetical protein [Pseudorhodoferax sp. Leaf267]|uniref:hypothetical protein n=1 Tax=Pseudorhodoferax sp. Leaf267 TaxID=1736316 RepID=UPI0006F51B90|nr:hypothetical protein [Pseudorhodoferax sp. Leaf267]KQP12281.1 hypothetical protein ASF43_22515 [Pseudorhodoferax sp. Leaf267]